MLNFLFPPDLTKTEIAISNSIIKNFDDIKGMSISNLAKIANVSPSKITKYAKKIGFTGYKELQYELKKTVSLNEKKQSSIEYQKEKITEFFNTIDIKKMNLLIEEIKKSSKIYFYGRGPSLKVAEYFVPRLRIASNKNIITNYDEYLFDSDLFRDEPNKLMILLTISGKTTQIHEVLEICKKRDIKTVVISAYISDELENNADLYINLLTKKEVFDRRVIRGRTLFFIYLEILTQQFMDINDM